MKNIDNREKQSSFRAALGDALGSQQGLLWAIGLLMVSAFLMGGSARGDVASLVLFRPLSFLILAFALWGIARRKVENFGLPFWLLVSLAVFVAFQLVPLPPSIWQSLPGRDLIAQADAILGLDGLWRPLTLSPSRTLNTLFALAAPLAVFVLFARTDRNAGEKAALIVVGIGAADAALSLLQIMGPSNSPLYLYRITNEGMPVGFFANRNHNAVFLASLLPLIAGLARHANGRHATLTKAFLTATALIAAPTVFATGSRTGSFLLGISMIATAFLYLADVKKITVGKRSIDSSFARKIVMVTVVLVFGVLSYIFAESNAYERFFAQSYAEELRWQVLPYLLDMIQTYLPVGSGFGSFYLAYKINEPDELLNPRYLNQAHNDVVQPLIEGGVFAAIIMLTFAVWLIRQGYRWWRAIRNRRDHNSLVPFEAYVWLSLVVLLIASLSDYPLRTPAIMVTASLFAAILARGGARRSTR